MESFLVIFGLLFVVTFIVLYFWSIFWSYKDASSRGKKSFAVAAFVALFAWPLGLLFWTIIRPEDRKNQDKPVKMKKSLSEPNKYILDFKEMPFFLKLLLIISLYFVVTTFINFIQMKPIIFEFFNSGFPRNYPFIWYMYYLLFNIATVVVYLKRSYTVLKKYLYVSVGILLINLLNSVYHVSNLPSEQRMVTVILYFLTYILSGIIIAYLLNQKKYFYKI